MNRFFTLLLTASCLTAVGQVPDYVPTDGLIGCWPLDGSGEDLSFFENDAEIFGSPTATTNRFGTLNSALLFDGASDRLISESFAGLVGNMPFAVSFWWKVDPADAGGVMVSYGNLPCTKNFYIESLNAACDEIEGLGLYSRPCLARRTDFSSYKDNSWHHCAFVYDGMGTDFAQMWLDGELYDLFYCAQSEENEILSLEPDATGLTVGERSDGNGNYKGSLDDLFIWNRALSSTEIQILYSQTPVFGCTDELSCIYNSEADADDGSCLYLDECGVCGGDGIAGCMDLYACNFDAEANCDDGSCDYSCCPGPGCCHEGTIWDADLQQCIVANPADINFDGCVQLGDLLDLLSAYGDCAAEESAWQCGDPLEYQGYDYETVQIGEQCWFAENLRNENYDNGDAIPAGLSADEWSSTELGATAIFGQIAPCVSFSPNIDACDPEQSLELYGRLYNFYSVMDSRSLCPTGWIVPSDSAWANLIDALGGEEVAGNQLKATSGWFGNGNGSDQHGFSGLPGGNRNPSGGLSYGAGYNGFWWSSTLSQSGTAWLRQLFDNTSTIWRNDSPFRDGLSVRCIKDAE